MNNEKLELKQQYYNDKHNQEMLVQRREMDELILKINKLEKRQNWLW
jgi:hypothetical protein